MITQKSWHDDWSGLRVAVLGLGKSGFSVADTLMELGCKVTVYAKSATFEYRELLGVIEARLVLSDDASGLDEDALKVDFVAVSPGFMPDHPMVMAFKKANVPIYTDVDLAWRLRDKTQRVAKWITITGTNGKTSTTELTAMMLHKAGYQVAPCGNIGKPILDAIRDPEGFDYFVVELSSFQLHYLHSINAEASAFLNLAEDHLDWHGGMEQYFLAKSKIFAGTKTAIIYNSNDSKTLEAAENAGVIEGCRAVSFSIGIPSLSSVGFVEEFLVDRAFIDDRNKAALELATTEDVAKIGVISSHLLANVAAASALARAVGCDAAAVLEGIRSFRLAPHRIQRVAEHEGVLYFDDSKATNAHAAAASLGSFENVVWIVGGLLKGIDLKPLLMKFGPKIRGAVIIGADTQPLEALFEKHLPLTPVRVVIGQKVMQDAVLFASQLASPGDVVLLAPAAASMDQFKDYSERGLSYQAAVANLAAEK
jgi:UDP-N-acetylmuramoylalanine--D-glutamate ligase